MGKRSAGLEETKRSADITPIARGAKRAAGKTSEVVLRDGAPNLNGSVNVGHTVRKGDKKKAQ